MAFYATATVVKASPSNNPVFATIQQLQQMISDALQTTSQSMEDLNEEIIELNSIAVSQSARITELEEEANSGFIPDKIINVCFHVDTAALTVMKGGTCFPHVHWKIPVQCVSGKPCQPDNPNDSFYDPPQ